MLPTNSKKCTYCKTIKTLDDFSFRSRGGKQSQCKKCINQQVKLLNYQRQTTGIKQCSICKIDKDVCEFSSCKSKQDGLHSSCKKCSTSSIKKWLDKDINNFIKKIFLSCRSNCIRRNKVLEFNITEQNIVDLYNKQDGRCAFTNEKLTTISYTKVAGDKELNDYNISIDRIDSSKGYTVNNIQLVGATINIMKNDVSDTEFKIMAELITFANEHLNKN